MTERADQKSGWGRVFVFAPLLLIMYVLSIGPVVWMCVVLEAEPAFLEVVYAPIFFVLVRSETLETIYFHYINWWVGLVL